MISRVSLGKISSFAYDVFVVIGAVLNQSGCKWTCRHKPNQKGIRLPSSGHRFPIKCCLALEKRRRFSTGPALGSTVNWQVAASRVFGLAPARDGRSHAAKSCASPSKVARNPKEQPPEKKKVPAAAGTLLKLTIRERPHNVRSAASFQPNPARRR